MGELYQTEPEAAKASRQELLEEMDSQAAHPPGGDPIIAAMWTGFLAELPEEPGLQTFLQTFSDFREGKVSERAGILRTVFVADILRTRCGVEDIPRDEPAWRRYFGDLGQAYREYDSRRTGHEERIDALLGDVMNNVRNVQTNIASRYLSVELLMQTDPRFKDGAAWLDIGCSVQQGQHSLALKQFCPLDRVNIVDFEMEESRRILTKKVQELLARPSLIRTGIGVDLFDPTEQKSKDWVRASLRPTSELLNPAFMAKFDLLASAEIETIEPETVDITDRKAVGEFKERHPDFEPNLMTIITTWHQYRRQGLEDEVSKNIRLLGSKDTLVALQDFAYFQGTRAQKLRPYAHWHIDYRYRMYTTELAGDSDDWREQLRFKNGHGTTMKLTRAMVERVLAA